MMENKMKNKEAKTMKKIINILSMMVCFVILNTLTADKGSINGMQYVGCGKSVYTNNSTIAEVPETILK
jgi:hypothetical protein